MNTNWECGRDREAALNLLFRLGRLTSQQRRSLANSQLDQVDRFLNRFGEWQEGFQCECGNTLERFACFD